MSKDKGQRLTALIRRLIKLDKRIVKYLQRHGEGDEERVQETLQKFWSAKAELKTALLEESAVQVDDPEARDRLQRLYEEEVFLTDKLMRHLGETREDLNLIELDSTDIDRLASDHFYSWTSGEDYVRALYDLGVVALGVRVPSSLSRLLSEARSCFALGQELAVVALCRSAVEAAMKDIARRKGLFKRFANEIPGGNDEQVPVSKLIEWTSRSTLRGDIREYYHRTSLIIHVKHELRRGEAKEIFRDGLSVINRLYESHRRL